MNHTRAKIERFSLFWRSFKKQKAAVLAGVVLMILLFLAIFSDQIIPYGINEYDYSACLQGPSAAHLFGTDEFGRDLFSRVISGTRISLIVGLVSVTIAAVLGCAIGLVAGYLGGKVDAALMNVCDVLYAFPGLILAIAIAAVLGPGMINVVIAVMVYRVPIFARLVRGNTLRLKNAVYVTASRNFGASKRRILFRQILPGALPNVIVQYSLSISGSIMTCAGLSFLGMGAVAPTPEWGLILNGARVYIFTNLYYALFPGLAIFITVLCFNLFGDGLRAALDPRFNGWGEYVS